MLAFLFFAAIEGNYNLNGYDAEAKSSYTGTMTITKDKDDVYQYTATMTEQGKEYKDAGTGIKVDDQLSFIFKSVPGQAEPYEGVQVYKIKGDVLEGPFVTLGKNLVGNEKLTKSSSP